MTQEVTQITQRVAYTAPEILLFIGAVAALLVQTIGAWRSGARSIDTNQKVGETLVKTAVIEGHVNSKETKYIAEIAALQDKCKMLELILADKDRTAALLAQSVTSRMRNQDISSRQEAEPQEVHIVNPKDDPVNVKEGAKK